MDSRRTATAAVMAALALTGAPAAQAAVDYSKNSATGDYAPASAPAQATPPPSADDGFAWGDAAVGAGAALGLALLVALGRELAPGVAPAGAGGSRGGGFEATGVAGRRRGGRRGS